MDKHSPGPWHDDGRDVRDANGELVPVIAHARADVFPDYKHEKADRRLCVNAPTLAAQHAELLEALERRVVGCPCTFRTPEMGPRLCYCSACKEDHALLKRAQEGRSDGG